MRGRKPGLLPLEFAILETGMAFAIEGTPEFHGFLLSAKLRATRDTVLFSTHGALYKALDRMERQGYLTSCWEDAEIALAEGRPRRRLYRVTAAGEAAVRAAHVAGSTLGLQQVAQA